MKRYLIAALVAVFSLPAFAQSVCGQRDEIVSRLKSGYQEYNSARGISTNGGLVELYTSEKGTWTLMLSQPNGVSCLIGTGENWQTLTPAKPMSAPL